MEASALQAPGSLTRKRVLRPGPLLRLRSDDQLVELFRAGNDEAFRVIHDRYRQRLFAYTRQMLPSSRQDAEDALQDVFVKAYSGLRANDRRLALRAWLYRVAHNRCVDQLRRPAPIVVPDEPVGLRCTDPAQLAEHRETLANLILDVQRLPEQQRSALLMRELAGMSYSDLATSLGVSVPAVKSLLVRARMGLTQASEARDEACVEIRRQLVDCHDRGVRATGTARRHLRDCESCREFRRDVRSISRRFSALVPTFGPFAVAIKLLGIGGGSSAATGTGAATAGAGSAVGMSAVGGGAGIGSGVGIAGGIGAGGGAAAVGGGVLGTGHVAALIAAALVTAGGAVALHTGSAQHVSRPAHHRSVAHRTTAVVARNAAVAVDPVAVIRHRSVVAGGSSSSTGPVGTTMDGYTGPGARLAPHGSTGMSAATTLGGAASSGYPKTGVNPAAIAPAAPTVTCAAPAATGASGSGNGSGTGAPPAGASASGPSGAPATAGTGATVGGTGVAPTSVGSPPSCSTVRSSGVAAGGTSPTSSATGSAPSVGTAQTPVTQSSPAGGAGLPEGGASPAHTA